MAARTPGTSTQGAVATGAAATGAASLAAMAMGAVALGAMAVGALAIGRLTVGRARLRRVEIGELAVGRLEVATEAGTATVVRRVRAAPGKGADLERLVLGEIARAGHVRAAFQAHRATGDPDLFLFCENQDAAEAAPRFEALLARAQAGGLLSGSDAAETFRAV